MITCQGSRCESLQCACMRSGKKMRGWLRRRLALLRAPGTYKIPTANDIPLDLRVTLLRDAPCRRTPQVHSSKAVGEPPLFLGASVFYALKVAPSPTRSASFRLVLSVCLSFPSFTVVSAILEAVGVPPEIWREDALSGTLHDAVLIRGRATRQQPASGAPVCSTITRA